MAAFFIIMLRDIRLPFQKGEGVWHQVMFYVLAVSLFPFGIGADPVILQQVGSGVIWVCALLSALLSAPQLYAEDYEDGSLEQMLLQGIPLPLLVGAKTLAHWLVSGIPLVLCSPFLAIWMGMPEDSVYRLMAALLAGTLALSFIISMGAAMTLGVKYATALLGIVLLPLSIPVLIFGAHSVSQCHAIMGCPAFSVLFGLMLFFIPVSMGASVVALKVGVERR